MFEQFIHINDHFAKTGSGQTYRKNSLKDGVFRTVLAEVVIQRLAVAAVLAVAVVVPAAGPVRVFNASASNQHRSCLFTKRGDQPDLNSV